MTDADKLRVLATWFDNFDDWREATGKIAPGITDYREVQQDLRRIADALAASQPPSGDAPDLREALNQWLTSRRRRGNWSGPPEWTAEDGYNAAVEEVEALAASTPSSPATPAPLDCEHGIPRNECKLIEHTR